MEVGGGGIVSFNRPPMAGGNEWHDGTSSSILKLIVQSHALLVRRDKLIHILLNLRAFTLATFILSNDDDNVGVMAYEHNKNINPLFILCFLVSSSCAEISGKVGVNYGQLGNNLPTPSRSVELIKSLKAKRVKIYDANPEILTVLKNTGLQVSIMVPNDIVKNMSTNQTLTDQWVHTNLVPFYPETLIRYLMVGNEMLDDSDNSTWFSIVPAMRKIKKALKTHGAHKVKVGTTLAMDVLQFSFPPSNGTFRSDISSSVMKPMLQFLNRTKSFLFLDVYPYFPWSAEPNNINLDYALFESRNITYTDPKSGLTYTNLFDQMVDSVIFAMKRVGYPDVRIWIAEAGWPNGGDIDQIGANIYNAATYNRNV
ncbi:probable glucan endo-1,3-beta-glucosidase A6 [Humulus lupulus]|uniref:probable glucan endo-1,3-beta-glucosidase A6 n=1 Tax=Humulus lupulus TaxID=3486 RepID=UPI002B40E496|nr:probable glucan endo-1,3-beta-glucosidase A6 [Humulus lupulus]